MYRPPSFREEDLPTLHDLMRRHSFATLFTQTSDGPIATHLPFMVDADRGPYGTLIAHMARANPHWRSFDDGTEVLVAFMGPHAYISPSWYEDQVTVPTWNYAVVYAYGVPGIVDDMDVLREQVMTLIDVYERQIDPPWDPSVSEGTLGPQLEAIVGFEIPIRRIEGAFKFNQNRSRDDQAGVVAALEDAEHPRDRAVAEIMRGNLADAPADDGS